MVLNRWRDQEADRFVKAAGKNAADQALALRVYTSRLIGQDKNLVLHGGGNTSCKLVRKDIYGNDVEVLHVKGSGHDLGTIEATGLPAVRLEPLRALRRLDGLSDEAMINVLRCNLLDATAPNPSVESLFHAFLPYAYIDHTHATAMLVLADLANAEEVVREIYGEKVAVIPFHMSGFDLAKAAVEVYEKNPGVEGMVLINHGHFAFGDTAKESYDRLIDQTNRAEAWLAEKSGVTLEKAGGPSVAMVEKAKEVLPVLRGIIGEANSAFTGNRDQAMPVMDLRCGENVQAFLARGDLETLAKRGVPTPDHVIRTKNNPLLLTGDILAGGREAVLAAVDQFVADYTAYYERNATRFDDGRTLLQPTPNLAWIEGVGLVGISANARAAAIAADLGEQAIDVMTLGEACGGYHPLGEKELFDMEYWPLEQAKLKTADIPPMQGRIVLVTGGGGAIGLATAKSFADLGADIFLVDLEQSALDKGLEALGPGHSGIALDVTAENGAQKAIGACIADFGGLDILVSNAGAAWTGEMAVLDDALLRKSFELNFFSHQTFAKEAARVFAEQGRGGQLLFNVSKQAVNPGKGFGAYGLPKATTLFLVKQLALELGPSGVRVNGINADRIRSGLLDDDFISERSKARGIDEATYMAGNLIHREVEAHHVGDAFVALALAERTTAHIMTVDGGNIEASLR